ncbi:MAG: hypothetical protein QM484_04555 [Woeseiaceae bacterium]
MDPLSAAFASYLELVSNTAKKSYADVVGVNETSLVVNYNGIAVPYKFQLWKIKDKTVCSTYSNNIAKYSKCTLMAKSLFSDTCNHMNKNKIYDGKKKQIRNMYCRAAKTFKPTVASISKANDRTPVALARSKCNMAIADAMGSSEPYLKNQKNEACDRYKKLLNK